MEINEIKKFLDKQNKEISELYKKIHYSYFNAITSGKKEFYKDYEKNSIEMENFFHNKKNFEKIKVYLKEKIKDELIKRQMELLYNSYLGSQGDINLIKKLVEKSAKIEQNFNTFRAKIKDKELTDNEIKEILKKETNSEKLKQTWEAS